jgi:hypothetical protein
VVSPVSPAPVSVMMCVGCNSVCCSSTTESRGITDAPAIVAVVSRLGCLVELRRAQTIVSVGPCPLHVFSSVSSAGVYALRFCLIKAAVVFESASSYGVGNRAAFSDSRSNFHTRVGYRTNVCRRRLASDLARASGSTPAQGAHEDHHDRLPGSPRHRSESMRRERLLSCCYARAYPSRQLHG